MVTLADFLQTSSKQVFDIKTIQQIPGGGHIMETVSHLPGVLCEFSKTKDLMRISVYTWQGQTYYRDCVYEYGPEIFGYHNPDLRNYVEHFNGGGVTKIFSLAQIAEKQYVLPPLWQIDYTRITSGFGDLGLMNGILRYAVDFEQKFKGHKGKWFRVSKSYIVLTCYVNALMIRFGLPIIPMLITVSQKADGSWPTYQKGTIAFADAAGRIKAKSKLHGNDIVTDAEIRMAYKLIYEHPSRYMREAAKKTLFFLEKHYGYKSPTDLTIPPLVDGYVPQKYRGEPIQPAIQYDLLDPDVLFGGFADRPRKGGASSYDARLAVNIPEWVRKQTEVLEELYSAT